MKEYNLKTDKFKEWACFIIGFAFFLKSER
jgi:hypothetical protein